MDKKGKNKAVVLGDGEDIITFAALLARHDIPLGAFFFKERRRALESTLLLGCPSYDNIAETLRRGNVVFIERGFSGTDEVCKYFDGGGDEEHKLLVLVSFSEKNADAAERVEDGFEGLSRRPGIETARLVLQGELPPIGRDICEVDIICRDKLHEALPEQDYDTDLSSLRFFVNGFSEEQFPADAGLNGAEPLLSLIKSLRGL
ncbi:hypothetical protein IJT93_11825 [bacterium]|nr:hypothetical protein [bacterium]